MEYSSWKKGETPNKSYKEPRKLNVPQRLALAESNKEIGFEEQVNFDKQIMNNCERDKLNGKLNDRYLVQQINQNPFLLNNNYIDDLNVQEKFLRPKSSYQPLKNI